MKSESGSHHIRHAVIGVLLIIGILLGDVSASAGASAQKAKKQRGDVLDEDYSNMAKPELLNADTNPTLRYPVASFSGWSVLSTSYGWFDVTRKGVTYTVVQPTGKLREGFEGSSDEITEIKLQYAYLQFKISNKKHTVFYVRQSRWGSIHSGPGAMQAAAAGSTGTSSMLQAMRNFDQVLASVKPAPPPAPEASLIAAPLNVQKGQSVTLSWTSANATRVNIQPGVGPVAATGTTSVTPDDTTEYVLTVLGSGGTRTATARVTVTAPPPAAPPTIVLIEPSVEASGRTLELTSANLPVRGVAMDATSLPIVTINGAPANMKPRDPHSADFWSDPVTLKPGDNKFEIVAMNSARGEARFEFNAHYTPPAPPAPAPNPKALDKQDIVDLLKNFVPSTRVADLVRQYGLKFTPTEADLSDIRQAGGDEELIEAIHQASPRGSTSTSR